MKIVKSKLFIAFVIVVAIAAAAVAYQYILHPPGTGAEGELHDKFPRGAGEFENHDKFQRGPGELQNRDLTTVKGWKGIMKQLGQISIILATISFGWFVLKKKIGSRSKAIKTAVKTLYSVHVWMGWLVIIAGIIHGLYFILTDFSNRSTWTGIAATILMLGLLVYGFYIRRIKNKFLKVFHRWLSFAWVPVLFLHGGGIVIQMVAVTVGCVGAVWLWERYLSTKKISQATH